MSNKPITNKPELKIVRQELRNNGTPAEAILWKALKNKLLEGRKFRRQFSIENYIVDFYCPSEKLAIELDGADHYTSAGFDFDEERTHVLNSFGVKVIRFENKEVLDDMEGVIEVIRNNFAR